MKSKEFLREVAFPEKKEYVPQIGDQVRIKGDTPGQTLAGRVSRIGRSGLYHVKLANGETVVLPASEIACRDLSCKNYANFGWNKEEPMIKEDDNDRFPEYMGGYVPPFNTEGNTVIDKHGIDVLECKNKFFARVVSIALNEHVRKN